MTHKKNKKIDIGIITTKKVDGFKQKVFEVLYPNVWAYARQLSRKEIFVNSTTMTDDEIVFIINYRADVASMNEDYHIFFNGYLYEVKRTDSYDFSSRDLKVFCRFTGKTPEDF